jgi:hypothetical protein
MLSGPGLVLGQAVPYRIRICEIEDGQRVSDAEEQIPKVALREMRCGDYSNDNFYSAELSDPGVESPADAYMHASHFTPQNLHLATKQETGKVQSM